MDSKTHAQNVQTFIDTLDDNQVKAFATNGLAALDDDTVAKYYHAIGFTPPQTDQREQISGMPVYDTGLPGIGKVADWTVPVADWLKQNVAQPMSNFAQETKQAYPGTTGKVLSSIPTLGAALTPQTPFEVKANIALPLAAEGIGMAGKAALQIPGVSEGISSAAQALSRLSAPLVKKVLETPQILSRYLPLEQAGQVMSNFFRQLGLKSGSEALEAAGETLGKSAPKLADYGPLADKTVESIKNVPQTMQSMQELENTANQLNSKLQQIQNVKQSMPGMDFSNTELDISNKLSEIKNQYTALQSQLPNAQDALASRTYISKMLVKQGQQAAENQVVSPIASKNLSLVDNYLDNEVDRLTTEAFKEGKELTPIKVPGYGDVTTPAQVRQIYHEAKIGDAFSSFFPQNRNGQVDSLRTFLGFLSNNPKALLESPQVWKRMIQGGQLVSSPATALAVSETGTAAANLAASNQGQ